MKRIAVIIKDFSTKKFIIQKSWSFKKEKLINLIKEKIFVSYLEKKDFN